MYDYSDRLLVHNKAVRGAQFSPDGARVVTASNDGTARVWDAASGVELARLIHHGEVTSAIFGPDGASIVTASFDKTENPFASSGTVRAWDATWAAKLNGDALAAAVARTRLAGEGRLTAEELRIVRPILGDVDPDVVSRWLKPSAKDAEVAVVLTRWLRHRERALALARKEWAARAAKI